MNITLIGTDEAGYGPNLGPLLVSATRWEISESLFSKPVESSSVLLDYLNENLSPICRKGGLFPILDSKKLYHSSGTVAPLEKTIFLARMLLKKEEEPDFPSFAELLTELTGEVESDPFWEQKNDQVSLPISTLDRDSLSVWKKEISEYLQCRKITLSGVQSRRIQPEEFNRNLDSGLLKSDIVAEATLQLVINLFPQLQEERQTFTVVLGDKLGGRNNYRGLLSHFFPDFFLKIIEEGRDISIYRLFPYRNEGGISRIPTAEIRFQAKGESNHPTALASIFSKYLRELSMMQFNEFWQRQITDLVPTAGYPVDAKRFWEDIAETWQKMNLPEHVIWRMK